MQGIELTQANLSTGDLLEGHWENITESNPCVPEPGKEVPTLTICLWGRTVSLSLSMASILLPLCGPVESVHFSSHVAQMWLVALIQA